MGRPVRKANSVISELVLGALRRHPEGLAPEQVAVLIGRDLRRDVRPAMSRLAKQGIIVPSGEYATSASGRRARRLKLAQGPAIKPVSIKAAILGTLENSPAGLTAVEMADTFGVSQALLRVFLERLKGRGLIKEAGNTRRGKLLVLNLDHPTYADC